MEQDVGIGSVGQAKFSLSQGKITAEASVALPAGLSIDVKLSDDASALIDVLKGAVEKQWPSSSPIDEAVFGFLKTAIQSA